MFLEATIKRQGNDPAAKISATSVVEDNEAEAEKEFTQRRAAEPDDMIEGWDPPIPDPNRYLSYRIIAAIAQVGSASVNDQLGSEGIHTE